MSECTPEFFEPIYDDSCGQFTEDVRHLDTDQTKQYREVISNQFLEQIDQWGTEVTYQQDTYRLSSHDSIYGEDTTREFGPETNLIMYVIFNSDSIILNRWGIESDADITAFIHISSFWDAYGTDAEPQMGDLIRTTEYGSTGRPNGRGEAVFEITRRDDEDLEQINPLMGHYVWLIRGKRYDYSYEDDVDPENLINQVHDGDSQSEGLTGTSSLSSVKDNLDKTYDQDPDTLSDDIFNYDESSQSNDDVYGDY